MLAPTKPRASTEPAVPLATVFADAVRREPTHPLVFDGASVLTRSGVAARAALIRRRLLAAGVRPGDVVAVQLPNRAWTVAVIHAVWSAGAVPCVVTPIYRGSELAAILSAARPTAVVVPRAYGTVDYPGMAAEALATADRRAAVLAIDLDAEQPVEETAAGADGDAGAPPKSALAFALDPPPAAHPDDVALLMFTSGTTGRPKGVLHTHRTLMVEAQSLIDVFGLGDDPVFMPSPLGHVTGLLYGIVLPLLTGGAVVLFDRWDPTTAAETIEAAGCRFTVAATPFLRGLTDAYRLRGTTSALEVFVCGGADIPESLVRDARETMGTAVCRTYGSTEMPTLCIVRPDDPPEVLLRTEGRLLGGQARLVDAEIGDDGVLLGDLEARGPELFAGYLDPADNASAFTDDGWFRTGDLARILPTGEIAITGRRKDLIVRGGENISAKEVEDLLLTHPRIHDVALVGIPDDVMGERACAVVVSPGPLTIADLTRHLDTSGIARQKFPEALWIVDSFPRTASGKVQKFQLRALAVAAIARGEVERR